MGNSFDIDDALTIEQGADSALAYYVAIQRAINSGSAWSLQGSFGRTMMEAIESGYCMLGEVPAHDYWGHRIPSRDEVMAGTKGSRDFVVRRMGEDWAEALTEMEV
jgi:hypothetical protein